MDIINILTFQKYRDSEALKDIAPIELLGGQNPIMGFFVKNQIADQVVKLEDKVTRLENELKEEKEKPSKPPTIYKGTLKLTSKMIGRLTEAEIGKLAGEIGADFDKNLNKEINAQALAAKISGN